MGRRTGSGDSLLHLGTIEPEVERYIGMPGQALAYMIGRPENLRMRAEAKATLGDRFDIKGFHDTVLCPGLVPLGTLDRMVKEWVQRRLMPHLVMFGRIQLQLRQGPTPHTENVSDIARCSTA